MCAGLLLAPSAVQARQVAGEVRGRVIDATDRVPVAGAQVELEGTAVRLRTASDGSFHVRSLDPRVHRVRVQALGYRSTAVDVQVVNARVSEVEISLARVAATLATQQVRATQDTTAFHAQIVDRAGIERSGARDVADVLQNLPGVVITRSGGPGQPSRVSIRGSSANQVLVLLDEGLEVAGADFFFAFEEEGEVDGGTPLLLLPGGDGGDVAPDLAFVVAGAAGVEGAVADGGFEGGRHPLVEGFGGLDVVVAVDEDGGAVGEVGVARDDGGVAAGGEDFGLEAEGGEVGGEPVGAALAVLGVFGDEEGLLPEGRQLEVPDVEPVPEVDVHLRQGLAEHDPAGRARLRALTTACAPPLADGAGSSRQ